MRQNDASVIADLKAVYGSRLREVSGLSTSQKAVAENLGTRRGLGWVPADGTTIRFLNETFILDLDVEDESGSVVIPAINDGLPVMVTVPSLCRMCENTREVLAQKCPKGAVNTLLQRGVSDVWRAEFLHGKTFKLKVFQVEKTAKVKQPDGSLVDKLDGEGKPLTYQATMIWLDQEVEDSEEQSE